MIDVTKDVFISYSRMDSQIVIGICSAFAQNGISFWIDTDGIGGGDIFPEKIVHAIENCKIAVFVSSVNSNKSKFAVREIWFGI